MIKLAVSSCFMHPDIQRNVFGPKQLNYLEQDMARFLASPDVMPILIPDLEDVVYSKQDLVQNSSKKMAESTNLSLSFLLF